MMALNVGRFAGSGVGNAPNHPTGFCGGRVPKRLTAYAKFVVIRRRRDYIPRVVALIRGGVYV